MLSRPPSRVVGRCLYTPFKYSTTDVLSRRVRGREQLLCTAPASRKTRSAAARCPSVTCARPGTAWRHRRASGARRSSTMRSHLVEDVRKLTPQQSSHATPPRTCARCCGISTTKIAGHRLLCFPLFWDLCTLSDTSFQRDVAQRRQPRCRAASLSGRAALGHGCTRDAATRPRVACRPDRRRLVPSPPSLRAALRPRDPATQPTSVASLLG